MDHATPVTILTGFLGAGKTTLLRRLLGDPQGLRFGVLVNDFGAVNIDADIVVEATAGRVTLENGCVCCSIPGDPVGALATLLEGTPRPDRILVEASGVSRPLPIAAALEAEALEGRAVLDGIFCLVDAATFGELDFEATELALDQLAGSDIAVLTKIDLVPPERVAAVEATLGGALPRLRLIRAAHGDVPRAVLFGPDALRADDRRGGGARGGGKHHDDAGHGAEHAVKHGVEHDREHVTGHGAGHGAGHVSDHGAEFAAWHWRSPAALGTRQLRAALRQLPSDVMRAKGVIRPAEGEGRIVVQIVGKRLEMAREDTAAPSESALVAIGRRGSFDPSRLDALMEACAAASAAEGAVRP